MNDKKERSYGMGIWCQTHLPSAVYTLKGSRWLLVSAYPSLD